MTTVAMKPGSVASLAHKLGGTTRKCAAGHSPNDESTCSFSSSGSSGLGSSTELHKRMHKFGGTTGKPKKVVSSSAPVKYSEGAVSDDESLYIEDEESGWWDPEQNNKAKDNNAENFEVLQSRNSGTIRHGLDSDRGQLHDIQEGGTESDKKKEKKDKKKKKDGKEKEKKAPRKISVKVTADGSLDMSCLAEAGDPEQAAKLQEAFEKWKAAQAAKKLLEEAEAHAKQEEAKKRSSSRHRGSQDDNADDRPRRSQSRARSVGRRRDEDDKNSSSTSDRATHGRSDGSEGEKSSSGRGRSVARKRDDGEHGSSSHHNHDEDKGHHRSKSVAGSRSRDDKSVRGRSVARKREEDSEDKHSDDKEKRRAAPSATSSSANALKRRSQSLGRGVQRAGSNEGNEPLKPKKTEDPVKVVTRSKPATSEDDFAASRNRSKSVGRTGQRSRSVARRKSNAQGIDGGKEASKAIPWGDFLEKAEKSSRHLNVED